MKKIISSIAILVVFCAGGFAQTPTLPPQITVVGEAEIRIAPDEAVFKLVVETIDMELAKAKSMNDEQTQKLIRITKEFKLEPSDVQSGYIRLSPDYRYADNLNPRKFFGYKISRDVTITLHDITKFESFFTEVVKAGITEIEDIELKSSQAIELQRKAKLMAIKAAQEKATVLTKEIGQAIGKALSIQENYIKPFTSSYFLDHDTTSSPAANYVTTVQPSTIVPSELESNFAPGLISIRASVKVSFELK